MPNLFMGIGYIGVFCMEQLVNTFMTRIQTRSLVADDQSLLMHGDSEDGAAHEMTAVSESNVDSISPSTTRPPCHHCNRHDCNRHDCNLGHEHNNAGRQAVGWVLLLALGVHSLIEGVAVGVERGSSLLIAIVAHKWVEAFSLGCAFYKSSGLSARKVGGLLLAYSSLTPIGIGIGLGLEDALEGRSIGVITGLCAGSFMYVATLHSVSGKDTHSRPGSSSLLQLVALALGFGGMALINTFIE